MNLSEPQLISPLLDGFVMGDPISAHHGVRACPAMHLETDKKHIVKIISLPDTQSKLDALLLAGAFSDKESALAYFKELADGVMDEAALLQKLARSEGFVAFEDWQMVPMEDDETGYDIYLLGDYQPTLTGVLQNNTLTHLQGINLGLDLCAALSVCRRNGFMFSNLKPSNIFICNGREFRIGDLGFLSLGSLEYASLPDKYRSEYTAPEISDAYSSLNTTIDTYAVGLILYQAYNDGKLPPVGMNPMPPCHADSALAEIILKACSVDPDNRWQDPVQMGQALANYMQSNTVNDTPIAPPPVVEEIPEPEPVVIEEDPEPSTEDVLAEVDVALNTAPAIIVVETPAVEEISEDMDVEASAEDIAAEETVEIPVQLSFEDEIAPEVEADSTEEMAEDENPTEETDSEETQEDEVAQILAQADDLIAYQLPDPPVAPDPIDVSLPVEEEPEEPAEESETEPEADPEPAAATDTEQISEETDVAVEDTVSEEDNASDEDEDEKVSVFALLKSSKYLSILAVALAIVLVLGASSFLYYQNYYLQTIDNMYITGTDSSITVTLVGDIDNSRLFVVCKDIIYGNAQTVRVENGVAVFNNLKPDTTYTLEVKMDGLHNLQGDTTDIYTTSTGTTINGFYATSGLDSTSAVLQFLIQGNDCNEWLVTYSAEGEEQKTVGFTGDKVTIVGLTAGKEYTFTLSAKNGQNLAGTVTTTYTPEAAAIQNITVDDSVSGVLKVTWSSNITRPEGGWMLVYSIDGAEQAPIYCQNNQGEILQIIPGAHYEISVTPADSSTTLVGTGVYDAPAAADFDGYLINKSNILPTKMFAKSPSENWNYAKLNNLYTNSNSTDSYRIGQTAALVAKLNAKTTNDDVLVTTLYVIRNSDGEFVSAETEIRTWDAMWNERHGTFQIPTMPTEVGQYTVDVYFDGAYAFSHSFEMIAKN